MGRGRDRINLGLVFGAACALGHGVWALGEASELPALFWLIAGGLALKAASDRERFVASR
jgi:hypothetical protein